MLSDDPVIQWCIEEALALRVLAEDRRQSEYQSALRDAQTKAQAQLKAAAG